MSKFKEIVIVIIVILIVVAAVDYLIPLVRL